MKESKIERIAKQIGSVKGLIALEMNDGTTYVGIKKMDGKGIKNYTTLTANKDNPNQDQYEDFLISEYERMPALMHEIKFTNEQEKDAIPYENVDIVFNLGKRIVKTRFQYQR